ncbi:hypothetical protein KBD09_00245 [Candidatus Woesebacteria bacterium]|nr:hypothetical protein [Candidatus Woesebacteria bacterium]
MHAFRTRITDLPRTYILYRIKHRYYLLCWLEHGIDESMYIWFDDNIDNSWEVTAKHSQDEIDGKVTIELTQQKYKIYDPHLSWHPSGKVHVSGYNEAGRMKERLIADKKAASLQDISNGQTVPFSQIVFPTVNFRNMFTFMGKGLPEIISKNKYYVVINRKGHKINNSGAKDEAYIIIDDDIIPKGKNLSIDFCIHDKKVVAEPIGNLNRNLIFSEIVSSHKDMTQNAFGLRLFYSDVEYDLKKVKGLIATCFNQESYDLFQLSRAR